MEYQSTIEYAIQQDKEDKLSFLRDQFHIPKDKEGKDWIYFTGNSLGLQLKELKNIYNKSWMTGPGMESKDILMEKHHGCLIMSILLKRWQKLSVLNL